MHRDPALIPLSHDHQHTLAHALRLRRAATAPLGERVATTRAFLAFAAEHVVPHFAVEEAMLERAVARMPDSDELRAARERTVAEHAALGRSFAAVAAGGDGADPAALDELGRRVQEHVRYEERTVFQLLQEQFGRELAAIVD
jgi:hypothetical protein